MVLLERPRGVPGQRMAGAGPCWARVVGKGLWALLMGVAPEGGSRVLAAGASTVVEPRRSGRVAVRAVRAVGAVGAAVRAVLATRAWPACAALHLLLVAPVAVVLLHSSR